MKHHAAGPALSDVLQQLAEDATRERISIGDLLTALADRALGALLFVFACPNVLPTLPGTSAILGAPLVILAAQLAFARKPWLPAFIATRSIARSDFQALIGRIRPWLLRAERMLRPRGTAWALPPMEYVVGLVCLLLAIVVLLPIPLGNMLPALAISMLALGVLERDGLWIVAGLATAAASAVLVSGVVFAAMKAILYMMMAF
ncbi:exopolysaccharide biosynthesis protein [Pseudoduganella albidiflava]|uniref:ABC transporter permease n=1 Tax=Pseudoduganella albidiflava TaxID=321983 RepID=A0AA87XTF6_9BURK|nr:exopolysaccharide biosynthesis protein [Pseudoduganella albidiflava]GGY30187.1 ABC transporter permease [Pseudoduganella albidiflava]